MSPGNPKLISQAQKTITATIIGLVIMFSAWILVNTFFLLIGVEDWTGLKSGWFIIECNVNLPETYLPDSGNLIVKTEKGNPIKAKIGQEFKIDIGFVPEHPISNIDISLNFNNDLLVLKKITPDCSSNFKMFLPANKNLEFDQEPVITKANNDGTIILSAVCFDVQTEKSFPQTEPIQSLAKLIFGTKNSGIAEIKLNNENLKLAASIGNVANTLENKNDKIEIIIE